MSRVGKKAIVVPAAVQLTVDGGVVTLSGPKGQLALAFPELVQVSVETGFVRVGVAGVDRVSKAMHGLYRSLLQNAVTGVTVGFERRLELSGVGYQCSIKSGAVELSVGYSKPVVLQIPKGINCTAPDSTHLVVGGVDRQVVGQFAAQLRSSRVPDPYKAKGVKYQGEVIKRKAGKAFGSGG